VNSEATERDADVVEQPPAESPSSLTRQYDEARAAGHLLLRLDPKTVRATQFCNRDKRSLLLHDSKFIQLTKSIAAYGQETPIRVRPIAGAAPFEFEIVSGHRRHAACLALDASTNKGFPVLAIVDSAAGESRDLVLKMYRENADREDLSPFETGMMFRQWLEAGVFETQEAISVATRQSKQNVSRYVALASLPDYVLAAFRDPRQLSLRWVSDLVRVVNAAEPLIRTRAASLAERQPAPPAEAVYAELIRGAGERPDATDGSALRQVPFELTYRANRFGIQLQQRLERSDRVALEAELSQWLSQWLERRRTQ
jgi:ParB family chromosome partitioning protein